MAAGLTAPYLQLASRARGCFAFCKPAWPRSRHTAALTWLASLVGVLNRLLLAVTHV